MGDHRLSVEMTLVGADGVQRKKEMWVNWHENRPKDVIETLMLLADESQMSANWPEEFEPENGNDAAGRERELSDAKREAEGLANYLWKRFYKEQSPNFTLCDSVAGVISQIDNMVSGLENPSAGN